MAKIVLTHAVEDVERWLGFKAERAQSIGAMGGSNVVDHVAADGSKNVAVTLEADPAVIAAGLASPPPELMSAMQRHGVIPPVIAHVEG